jgi:hypothetical protein
MQRSTGAASPVVSLVPTYVRRSSPNVLLKQNRLSQDAIVITTALREPVAPLALSVLGAHIKDEPLSLYLVVNLSYRPTMRYRRVLRTPVLPPLKPLCVPIVEKIKKVLYGIMAFLLPPPRTPIRRCMAPSKRTSSRLGSYRTLRYPSSEALADSVVLHAESHMPRALC